MLRSTRRLVRLARAGASSEGDLPLPSGARIAVVGGGPAGSLFAFFALRLARTVGLELEVDVFEPRDFERPGPAGCNHRGGVVSESLVQLLALEGLPLPPAVIQRGLDSYELHLDVGTVRIDTPLHEKRIAAVHRGNGPRGIASVPGRSFDAHLLRLAAEQGARVRRSLVTDLSRADGRPVVATTDGSSDPYDLLVVASGVNSALTRLLPRVGIRLRPADTTKTFITELHLGRERVSAALGSSMHVFLLDVPRLEFAALIPKGDLVTCCLLGRGLDEELVHAFLDSPEVRACFPEGELPPAACRCFPRINVRPAWPPYGDRVVLVGDAGVTRLYKDGIGAAYRTAKAAATTAVLQGVAGRAFARRYAPACRRLVRDNTVGRFLFALGHVAQHWRGARRAVLRMLRAEQGRGRLPQHLSGMMWDMFTGSAPYVEVLARGCRPSFVAGFSWHLAGGGREMT